MTKLTQFFCSFQKHFGLRPKKKLGDNILRSSNRSSQIFTRQDACGCKFCLPVSARRRPWRCFQRRGVHWTPQRYDGASITRPTFGTPRYENNSATLTTKLLTTDNVKNHPVSFKSLLSHVNFERIRHAPFNKTRVRESSSKRNVCSSGVYDKNKRNCI